MTTIAKTTTPTPISDYLRTKNYAYMIYTNTCLLYTSDAADE